MPELRPYQTQDYDQVLALYQNRQAYGGNFDAGRDEADKLAATSEKGNLYVAVEGRVVLGTFMVLDNPHTFWLLRFAVDPALENNQEIAQVLFNRACELAAGRGHANVIAYTDSDDETLNGRYEALGCHKAGNYRCY